MNRGGGKCVHTQSNRQLDIFYEACFFSNKSYRICSIPYLYNLFKYMPTSSFP